MKISDLSAQIVALAAGRGAERFTAGSVPPETASSLLAPERLGDLLAHPLVRYPQVRVASSGKPVPSSEYVESRRIGTQWVQDGIDARRVARWLTCGATITLDSLEYLSDPVREICGHLSNELGMQTTATAYVTPPGRQGLSPHTDEEDVFVLQTFGTKRWTVDNDQRQEIATASGFPFNEQMKQVRPRVLSAGNMFFMPAGTPHVATTQENLSIHITFSVERPRVRHILDDAVNRIVSDLPELRKLQSWITEQPDVSALLGALELELTKPQPYKVSHVLHHLPFTSWANLYNERNRIRLKEDATVTKTEDGFSFSFEEFAVKVNSAVGTQLERLELERWVTFSSGIDSELKEVLFHLAGRNVVEVGALTSK